MTLTRTSIRSLSLVWLTWFSVVGCMGGPTGDVELSVSALDGADVDRVEVTIEGAGISPPIVQELSRAGGEWRGAIGGIPAGPDRSATVVAYDASGMEIFRGDSGPFVVLGDDTVSITVLLHPSSGATTTMESPPTIDSVVVAPGVLSPGQTAAIAVTATDPDPGDTLTYAWSATAGTFADASAAATSYTAPATEGTVTLTITVTDSQGSGRTVSIDLVVSAANERGTARVTVTVNTWPAITRFAAIPGLVPGLGTASTVITASDADGDAVTITYTQDCAGGAIDPDGTFHAPPAPPPGTEVSCLLHATASDGRGGLGHATAVVYVGDEITANHAPVIETSFASNWEAVAGDGVSFDVTASDPDAEALTYHWTASSGTLDGTPLDGTRSNHWISAGPSATITVRVTDARGAWVEHAFVVGAPSSPACGGTAQVLVSDPGHVWGVAVDATHVYWGNSVTGTVSRRALAGGPTTVLATGQGQVVDVAVAGGYAYWAVESGGLLMRVPVAGGTPEVLLSGVPGALGIAVSGGDLWYSRGSAGTIARLPLVGGPSVPFTSTPGWPSGLAIGATDVYWASNATNAIRSLPIAGGSPSTVASATGPNDVALDGTTLYWTNHGGTTVMRADLGGGAPVIVATAQVEPSGIAVDASCVYWTSYANGQVWSVAR